MSAEVLLCQGRVGRGTACGAAEPDPRGRLTVLYVLKEKGFPVAQGAPFVLCDYLEGEDRVCGREGRYVYLWLFQFLVQEKLRTLERNYTLFFIFLKE